MRSLLPFLLLLALAAAAPAAGQGIVVPVRCQGECPGTLPLSLPIDSAQAWVTIERGHANTTVDYLIRNPTAGVIDGAFFFPLPTGATITRVAVEEGEALEVYGEWSGPEESRWIMDGILRERPEPALREYAEIALVHVRVPSVPARGTQRLQIQYSQPLRMQDGAVRYTYPLSVGAAAAPIRHLEVGMEIRTEHGFGGLLSPSHPVDVEWGTEMGRCPPRARCGFRGVTSHRVKVVRVAEGRADRSRDFEVVYTPLQAPAIPDVP
jgi:hypothetical protein